MVEIILKICFLPFCGGITLYTLSAKQNQPYFIVISCRRNPKLAEISTANSRFQLNFWFRNSLEANIYQKHHRKFTFFPPLLLHKAL